MDESDLRFLVEQSSFVPQNRKDSFLKGLYAGVKMDYITSMSILMPQVENAIRCLAEDLGAVTFKLEPDGSESCLSLSTILDLPEVREHLEEDFIFYLKAFYTSKYGYGMRDNVAHGLYSDSMMNSYDSVMVWWYTLRICVQYCSAYYDKRD